MISQTPLARMRTLVILVSVCMAAARGASAQQKFTFVGPNECINCHDHQAERTWYEKQEIPEVRRLFPDRGDKAGHINSLKQLDEKKGDEWAAAIGLKDKYDPNGVCVRCHATVFAGDANAGVSCESCHGAASGYLKPHQTKDTYDQMVAQFGMTRLIGNMQGWTQQCTNCHVMDDDRLIKAGHPNGDDFDLGVKHQPVALHFKKKYAQSDIAAIAKGEMEGIMRRRGRVATPAVVPPTAPSAPEPPSPPPTPPPTTGASKPGSPEAKVPAPGTTAPPVTRRRPPSDPPPGSPTSIEPPPPLPGESTPPAASSTPPPSTPPPPPATSTAAPPITPAPRGTADMLMDYWWAVAGGVLLIAGLAFWLGTKKRG